MTHQTLPPGKSVVEFGKLLSLYVKGEERHSICKQVLVAKTFDYYEILNRVRREGHYRTEAVLNRLSEILIAEGYVLEPDSVVIDLGEIGRPSSALTDAYKHELNDTLGNVEEVVYVLEKSVHVLHGPEGDLHILKTGSGPVLGHVKVIVSNDRQIERETTLDIVGPPASDFPDDIQQQIQTKLSELISSQFSDSFLALKTLVRRSDLAVSEDILMEA